MSNIELKATALGQNLARHPYNCVRLLPAGVEVSGARHQVVIPFKDLVAVRCKRGLVWGELEFELPDERVVRLHGTSWQETGPFHQQLMQRWLEWDLEVIPIAQGLLNAQAQQLYVIADNLQWLTQREMRQIVTDIHITLRGLPLPEQRLPTLIQCAGAYALCRQWLSFGEQIRSQHNDRCYEVLSHNHSDFFAHLNPQQGRAILCNERWVQVEGIAGSGKSELLLAKGRWLLEQDPHQEQQVVLLVNHHHSVQEMRRRLQRRTGREHPLQIMTFTEAALALVRLNKKQEIKLTRLEQSDEAEKLLLIQCWQQQCSEKRAYRQAWHQWLVEEMGWTLSSEQFWQEPALITRLLPRLQRWLQLQRMEDKSQGDIVQRATERQRPLLQKQLRLLAPLLKVWKSQAREEKAIDSYRLMKMAAECAGRNRKVLPWCYLLVDDLQNCPPPAVELIAQLVSRGGLSLMSTEDPVAGCEGFCSPAQQLCSLLQQKEQEQQKWIEAEQITLSLSYRPPQAMLAVARHFLDPYALGRKQPISSQSATDGKSLFTLPQEMLPLLLDKLSGTMSSDERVLLLTRYAYMQPECLQQRSTRWPRLALDVVTMDACDSLEAETVIICGLNGGEEGFPPAEGLTALEEALLPESGSLPAGREQRLFYRALTRAKKQLWLLYDPRQPSLFLQQLDSHALERKKRP